MWVRELGGSAPHSDALKPLIEQPIAIYFLTVAGGDGEPRASHWLIPHFQALACR